MDYKLSERVVHATTVRAVLDHRHLEQLVAEVVASKAGLQLGPAVTAKVHFSSAHQDGVGTRCKAEVEITTDHLVLPPTTSAGRCSAGDGCRGCLEPMGCTHWVKA